jgi:hypothetical protein
LKAFTIKFGVFFLKIFATQGSNCPINPEIVALPLNLNDGFDALSGAHFSLNRFEPQAGFILASIQQFFSIGQILF